MKSLFQLYTALILGSVLFFSCEKAEEIKTYPDAVASELTISPTGKNASFLDSSVAVLNLSWTDPKYAQERSLYKFFLEIDSTDGDFKRARIIQLDSISDFRTQLLGYQINSILVGYGFNDPSKKYDIYIRIVSSYSNNNERKASKSVKVQIAPYGLPKVTVPANGEMWVVGGATDGGWNNPLAEPYLTDQKFKKISPTKYELDVYLISNQGYLVLPVMGSWDQKYCIDESGDRNALTNGGDFVFKTSGGQDFLSPQTEGLYKMTFDFMTGKFTVEAR